MKRFLLPVLLSSATIILGFSNQVFASQENCKEAKDALHCAYVDQAANFQRNKYIKFTFIAEGQKPESFTACTNNSLTFTLNNTDIMAALASGYFNQLTPSHPIEFSIRADQCQNEKCLNSQSKTLGTDKMTITQIDAKNFAITPPSYGFSGFDFNYGTDCRIGKISLSEVVKKVS